MPCQPSWRRWWALSAWTGRPAAAAQMTPPWTYWQVGAAVGGVAVAGAEVLE
jgi:hypothetical protein